MLLRELMQTLLLKEIYTVLKNFDEFWQGETLQRQAVVDAINAKNSTIIKALIGNEKIRKTYSTVVDGVELFDFSGLVSLIRYKEYWQNSYTRYRSSIGLTVDGLYLDYNSDVVLSFPYKDCVLEGGMTKEESSKQEIFYNETIAQDEVDRLLEPKVLCNAVRFTKNGPESVAELTNTDNLIVKGNNLLVLHSLVERYRGKIKLIYIDPPYNTENDSFEYNDKFSRSTWLTFMKNRLEIAKSLLSDDGAIFVQCDDKEQAYLKVLMDEIFEYKETIVALTSTPSGVNAINVKRGEQMFKLKEYILFYAKKKSYRFKPLFIKSKFNKNYKYEVKKNGEMYEVRDLSDNMTEKELEEYCLNNPNYIYSLEKNNKKAGDKIKQEIERSKQNEKQVIEFLNSKGREMLIYDGGVFISLKERIITEKNKNYYGVLIGDLWDDEVFQTSASEGGVRLKNGKKPEKLLERIINLTTEKGDIVLDFHLGSGTTCAVAHKMGRQYIGVEQIDNQIDLCLTRLNNVINGEQSGISSSVNWQGGGGFVYFELAKFNQNFIDDIVNAKDTQALLDILYSNKFTNHAHLNYQVQLENLLGTNYQNKNETVEFMDFSLKKQKELLIALLDKNQLYVNLSEMDDIDFAITEQDKLFTRSFYQNT